MKTTAFIFFVSLSGLLIADIQGSEAVNIRSTGDISNTRSYKRIDSMIKTIEKEVRNDLTTLNSRISKDKKTQVSYEKNLRSYTNSISTFKRHLSSAQSAYRKFDALVRVKTTENSELLKSLVKQRQFIKQERKYIDHMEAESLRLKKFSPRYKVIRTEIRQMRVQVNKEIADVERAYRLTQKKVLSERNNASVQKTKTSSQTNHYTKLVTRYQGLYATYHKLLLKLKEQGGSNAKLMKELNDQLDLLEEIRTILATFKPGSDLSDKYQKKFETCTEEFRVFRNKYQNMNCTAI